MLTYLLSTLNIAENISILVSPIDVSFIAKLTGEVINFK